METVRISKVQARNLPRSLLRSPSPLLEIHTQPTALPIATTVPQPHTANPSWSDFHHTHHLNTHGPPTIGFLIRDAIYPDPPLGRCHITVENALVQGWYPLLRDGPTDATSSTELFVCIERQLCCTLRDHACPFLPHALHTFPTYSSREYELRQVAAEPGAMFRAGELIVAIAAQGFPASARIPHVRVVIDTQVLRGDETSASSLAFSSSSEEKTEGVKDDAIIEGGSSTKSKTALKLVRSTGKGVTKMVSRSSKKKMGSLPFKIATAGRFAGVLLGKNPTRSSDTEHEVVYEEASYSENTEEKSRDEGVESVKLGEDGKNLEDKGADNFKEDEAGPNDKSTSEQQACTAKICQSVNGNAKQKDVDFGTFRFAVFQGSSPKQLRIRSHDRASKLPSAMALLFEQIIDLPDLSTYKCSCLKGCNSHILNIQVSDSGPANAKIIFNVTMKYKTWAPVARCTDVTSRFHEIFPFINEMADSFKTKFPHAEKLTYLLVGGLFTDHYPTYYEKNIHYLQEVLCLPRVQCVPVHTEGSIARNSKIIRDSIIKTCRGAKSIVLIGHSKGGVDAVSVLLSFPEVIPFIQGIITFQAPFGGTFLIDFLIRSSKFAVSAITGVIEIIMKGDPEAFLDMGYTARLRSVGYDASVCSRQLEQEVVQNPEGPHAEASDRDDIANDVERKLSIGEPLWKINQGMLNVFEKVPIVSFGSSASFDVLSIRSAANAAGVASMAPAAQNIVHHTGFLCDGLVTPCDARIPNSDYVEMDDMMHTEPALYVQGTAYPPGQLTASALVLLLERAARSKIS